MKKMLTLLIILLSAAIPCLAFAQVTPPQIIVKFNYGVPIPLEHAPLLAALGIILIVLVAGRMGKLRNKGMFISMAASLVLIGSGLFYLDTVRAQMAQRTLDLVSSPAILQIQEGQNETVLVRNKTGRSIVLQSIGVDNEHADEYSISAGATCAAGLSLENEASCEIRVVHTSGGDDGDDGDGGDGGDDGTTPDFISNPQTPDDFIERVQALANGDPRIPLSTPEELEEAFESEQNHEVIARKARLQQNHNLVLAAVDPDPTWHKTEINTNFIVAEPGESYVVDLSKVDPQGNNLGAPTRADQAKLRFEVRVQENETTINYVPSHSHDDYIRWDENVPGRLHINVPADIKQGRLLIGIRPKFSDKGQAAIAERWSAPVVVEIWPKRTGVTSIGTGAVYYPTEFREGVLPRSGSAFSIAEITGHLEQAYADFPDELLLKPLVVSGANLSAGQLIDARIPRPEGGVYPYSGRVARVIDGANGQQLVILNFDLASVYELLENDPLVNEGVMPEFVTYRQGPAQEVPTEAGEPELEYFGPEERSDIKTQQKADENAPANTKVKLEVNGSCNAAASISLVYSPILQISPRIDAGIEYSVAAHGIKVECSVTLDGSIDITAILAKTLPVMRIAALVGVKLDAGPYGEAKISLIPKTDTGSSSFFKAEGRATLVEGLSSPRLTFSSGSPSDGNGLDAAPWGLEGNLGVGAGLGFDLRLEPLSILGGTFRVVGIEGKAGVNMGVGLDTLNAAAVKAWSDSSSAGFSIKAEAGLTVSSGFVDFLGFLGIKSEASVTREDTLLDGKVDADYVISRVRDSGQGDGSVYFDRLSLPTLLKLLFTGTTAGYTSLDESSVYNDPTDNVTYEIEECVSSGGVISTPVIACIGGSFCGNANKNADFCKMTWVTPLTASAYVGETASTGGTVGREGSGEPIQVSVSGSPLEPQPASFTLSAPESRPFSASALCEKRGVTTGTIQALVGGKVADEQPNTLVCKCLPGSKDCDRTWASPHMITADGLAYDYVASGDYILARVHDAQEQPVHGFEVQSRFLPGYDVSWPQVAAMQVGDDVVEVRAVPFAPSGYESYGYANALELYVNGRLLASVNNRVFWQGVRNVPILDLPSGGRIHFDDFVGRGGGHYWAPRELTVFWPRNGAFSEYAVKLSTPYVEQGGREEDVILLEVQIIRSDAAGYRHRGMLGNNDGNPANDFVRRNGQTLAQDSAVSWTALYSLFGGDWLVKPRECLFIGGCLREPDFPTRAVALTDEQRVLGEIACAGLTGYYREACIHDVGLSGSTELVESYYANTEDLNDMAERLVTPGVDVPLYLLSIVGARTGLPEYDGEGFKRAYRVTHQSGEGEFLLTIRPPRGASAFFSEGSVGALTQSFTATGSHEVSVDVWCDTPDPQWAQLGDAWASAGTVQLWAVDPLSGFASRLLGEKRLACVSSYQENSRISAGAEYTVFLDDEGQVWAWGSNDYGQLGDGTTTDRLRPVPVDLAPLEGSAVVVISAGMGHTVALDDQGRLWAWGLNNYGQLGDGTFTYRSRPVLVDLASLEGSAVVAVSTGGSYHTVALDDQGRLWAWGENDYGQLGDGTTTTVNRSRPAPVDLAPLAGSVVVAIAISYTHTVVRDDQGRLWAWGSNSSGQLGDGTTTSHLIPALVGMSPMNHMLPPWIVAASSSGLRALAVNGQKRALRDSDDGGLPHDGTSATRKTAGQIDWERD
ncbi:MAG: hypothetical protein LBS40_01335 [Burkholderiales bacterium]|jgi:hypothetical protein|nr:hypothetical protein [Burkholderiales bacterium]